MLSSSETTKTGASAPARLASPRQSRPRRSVFVTAAVAVIGAVSMPALPVRSAAAAGGEGSWTTPPPPAAPVYASIQLPNGTVLGAQQCGNLVCSQVFDPLLGLWTTSRVVGGPSKNNSEKLQTLISLGHGHALATLYATEGRKFRYNGSGWVSLPPEKDWTYIRTQFATTTLLDPPACRQPVHPPGFEQYPCGSVLIAGGQNLPIFDPNNSNAGEVDFTADLYTYDRTKPEDPGKVLPLARMPEDHPGHRAGFTIPLDDGRVLVAGGNAFPHTQAVFFDPMGGELHPDGHREGEWSWAESMPHAMRTPASLGHTQIFWTARIPGSRARFLVGGGNGSPLVFDPAGGQTDPATGKPMGSWAEVANCKEGVVECTGGVLRPDGTILAVTRTAIINRQPPASFVLDPAGDDPTRWGWTEVAPPDATATFSSAVLLDGAGKPEQCGANCGLVLASGYSALPSAGVGTAQLFGTLLEVTGVSPPEGPACGGRPVTISGRGLDRVTAVNFGTERVEAITRNPYGSITVPSPRHGPGPVPVTVSTAGGATTTTKASANAVFTYLPATAQVSSLSKKEGPARGGTKVEIAGSFTAECVRSVSFGTGEGRDATAMSVSAPAQPGGPSTKVSATSPPGPPGEVVGVSVNVDPGPPAPAGQLAPSVPTSPEANQFTYRALPTITAIDKAGVSALGGTEVTITGTGFDLYPGEDTKGPRVFIDSQSATKVTPKSPTVLTAVVPPIAPGKTASTGIPVTVETDGRGLSAAFTSFAYHPGISGIFPPTGPTTGGTAVTLAGRGFASASGARIAGADAVVTRRFKATGVGADEIVFRTPAHEVLESVPVQVIAAGLVSLEPIEFTYGAAPPDDEDPGDPDTGPPPRQGEPGVQPVTPGGTGAPSPINAPSLSSSPAPLGGGAPAPGASPAPGGSGAAGAAVAPGGSAAPVQAPSSFNSPVGAAVPAPGPAPVAAPGAAAQGGPGSAQGAVGSDDGDESQGARRYAMTDASATLALGGAGAAGCFSWLAAARRDARRRRASAAGKPCPKGAY